MSEISALFNVLSITKNIHAFIDFRKVNVLKFYL